MFQRAKMISVMTVMTVLAVLVSVPAWAQYGGTQAVTDTMRLPAKFHAYKLTAGQRLIFTSINGDTCVVTTADINGGAIDGTTIGAASAAAGTFTTLTASAACNVHPTEWAVVDSAGNGDYNTVDGAIDAGYKNIYICPGTYGGFTADVDDLTIVGSGWDVVVDGTTVGHAVNIGANNVTISNFSVRTTPGGGNSYHGVTVGTFVRVLIDRIQVIDVDKYAIYLNSPTDSVVRNCFVGDADEYGIVLNGNRCIVEGCIVDAVPNEGIEVWADNCSVVGNHCKDRVHLLSGADNNIVDGNIMDDAVSDAGAGNTIGDNEVY